MSHEGEMSATSTPNRPTKKRKQGFLSQLNTQELLNLTDYNSFCEEDEFKFKILESHMLGLHTLVANLSTKMVTMEDDLKLVKHNTLITSEPIDTEQKLAQVIDTVNQLKDALQAPTVCSRCSGNISAQRTEVLLTTAKCS